MKSLAPMDYESLPALDAPAGYVCVIRDIDHDLYRIDATHWPMALIDSVLAERERSFGIELVSLLETDDLFASEAAFYARHHARLSSEWLELDALQLEELRQSMLQIDAYASQYLMPGRGTSVAPPAKADLLDGKPAPRDPSRRSRRRNSELVYKPFGTGALRRHRERSDSPENPTSWSQSLSDEIDNFIVKHPGIIVAVILIALLLGLMFLSANPIEYGMRF